MPAETSIGLSQETRDRLDDYRAPGHASMEDVLESLLNVVPSVEQVARGCQHCGDGPWIDGALDDIGGVIEFFYHEAADRYVTGWYCSRECAAATEDEMRHHFPREPDAVIIGGYEEWRQRIEGNAEYYVDDQMASITFDIPKALDDYEGEPVYIADRGEVVQTYVVDEIYHEEGKTALHLTSDAGREAYFHPDDEEREQYRENHNGKYDQEDGEPRPVLA